MRVCSNCWRGNLISNYALRERYGIHLVEPLGDGDPTRFIERCFGKVFFFIQVPPAPDRKRFTYAPCDFGAVTNRR
jgi:hypothetical protein